VGDARAKGSSSRPGISFSTSLILMLHISSHVIIPDSEIDIHAMRSQGAGGQNVNKVSSAIHLQFDIAASSLPPFYKEELLKLKDHRISQEGVITIKAQQYRSQEQNREDALTRLSELIRSVAIPRKKRRATKPTKGSQNRRIESKKKQGRLKALRGTLDE
jgi:ribosome-associated protein